MTGKQRETCMAALVALRVTAAMLTEKGYSKIAEQLYMVAKKLDMMLEIDDFNSAQDTDDNTDEDAP